VKSPSILILALAAGALGAQDAPKLDGRIQLFAELTRPAEITVALPDVKDQPKRQTGLGLRFLGEVSSYPGWYYEFGGMFDTSSNFTSSGAVGDNTGVKVSESYWSLGAAYMATLGEQLTLGAHLEGRGEAIRVTGASVENGLPFQYNKGTTYLQPWVRGSADYTFNGIGKSLHPYIGVEGSVALTRTTQTSVPAGGNIDSRTLRSLAPRASAALYAGIRF